ncbi:hypothetical protein ACMXKO_15455 (plasmid) [Clostridium tyrobutyricum]|uniref:hypothetical protein n=1 Tax=Clostridium tyrobutyricum TaxID=1519 RepID=UPI0039F6ABA9
MPLVTGLLVLPLLKENKFNEAEEYTERAKSVVEVFDLGLYQKYELDLYLAKEKQDKEKAIELIINMVNEADSMDNMKSKLYKHRKCKSANRGNTSIAVMKCKVKFKT